MLWKRLKRGVILVALSWVLALLLINVMALGGRAVAVKEQSSGEQTAEKTVEQTRKNIQVLKGLPDAQLRPLMNLISASLGVTCAHCHVRTGEQWEFEKDDKKNKQTARRMIQMTMELNKNFFEGKPEVSCYTCHQSHDHPISMPSLPRVMPEAATGPRSGEAWVTPQQVLTKYVQAIGGKEAAEKIKTRLLKGTQVMANGASLPLEVYFVAPDKMLTKVITPQQGEIIQALNGATGWLKNARQQRGMDNLELTRAKSLAWSLDPLPLKEPYPRLTFGGKEKIGEREAWQLRLTTPDKRRLQLYFDTQTGLLLRRVMITDTIIGPEPEQIDFEDYREVDGVKVPFTIRFSTVDPLFSATRKFTEVKHNLPMEEAHFNPPVPKQ